MTTEAARAGALDFAPLRRRHPALAGLVALPFLFPWTAGPSVNVWQLLASWACVALWCLLGLVAPPARGLWLWLAGSGAAIALIGGPDPGLWLPACAAVAVVGVAACLGAGLARADERTRALFAWGLLAAGIASAVLGLLQYYELAGPLVPWTTTPDLGQAYGNLRQRNLFATLLGMALVAALWLHAAAGGRVARRWLIAAMALLAVAAAASTSRTGLLQWVGVLGVAAFIARRERLGGGAAPRLPPPWLLLALIAVYFAASWCLPRLAADEVEHLLQRFSQGAPPGHGRLVLWSNVLTLIGERPWFGWGWGELAFAHYSTLYAGPRFVEILDNAHSLPLHLAVELGVPAALLICAGFVALVLAARPWAERAPMRLMAWGVLGAIVLHSLLEYPLWYGPFQLVFGLCLGLLWPAETSRRKRAAAATLPAASAMAIVLMAIGGYAAWDYIRISQLFLVRAERLPPYREQTLAKLQDVWLFANQVRFAELSLTPLTAANARAVHALARQVIHFSPEPRVIVKLIDSCVLLGLDDEARAQVARLKIAFPHEYARWLAGEPVEGPPRAQ